MFQFPVLSPDQPSPLKLSPHDPIDLKPEIPSGFPSGWFRPSGLQILMVTNCFRLPMLLLAGLAHLVAADYASMPLSFEPNLGQAPAGVHFVARGAHYSVRLASAGPVLELSGAKAERQNLAISFPGARQLIQPEAVGRLGGTVNYFVGKDRSKWRSGVPTFAQVRYAAIYPGIDVIYYGQQRQLEYDFNVAPHADPAQIRIRFAGAGKAHLDSKGDLVFGDGPNELRQHRPLAWQERNHVRVPVAAEYKLLASGEAAFEVGEYDHSAPLVIDPVLGYGSYLGGSGTDGVTSVRVDASGALFVAGYTSSTSFRTTAGVLQTANKGRVASAEYFGFGDAFVAKFSPVGSLVYSTYLGGSDDDLASALALDASGNAYVAGLTRSADFPVTPGAFQTRFGGRSADLFFGRGDAFVVKLSPDGARIIYGSYLGGTLNDAAWSIAVDSGGNAVIAGDTMSTDFPTSANAISRSYRGGANAAITATGDGWVAKLNPAGSSLVYGSYLGGRSHDLASGVATDAAGNLYVCGLTYSSDFPVSPGAFQTRFRGVESTVYRDAADDGWVMKINPAGAVTFSTYIGGSSRDGVYSIAVDAAGNSHVTGRTLSRDFPVTTTAAQRAYGGSGAIGNAGDWAQGDAFIAKLNPSGSELVYSTYMGGGSDDFGVGIALDAAGNAYVAGFTLSSNFPLSADALQKTNAGFGGQGFNIDLPPPIGVQNTGDAFVAKVDVNGAFVYSSLFGGSQDDAAASITVDGAGSIYIGGITVSANLPVALPTQGAYGGTGALAPRGDGFVAKFDFGGTIAATPARIAFVTGSATTGSTGARVPLSVEVLNASGAAIAGVTVNFSATGATVSPATAVTDNQGRASTMATLGPIAQTARVSASVAGLPPVNLDIAVTAAVAGPTVTAVVNGATFLAPIAPGSWLTVGGTTLSAARVDASSLPLPTQLGSVRVRVNGQLVPLLVALPTQINVQLPYETPVGRATLTVESEGVVSAPFNFTVQATAPGIFQFGANRAVAQNYAADGSLSLNTSENPAQAGQSIVVYFTGQGALDNPIPTGTLAGASPLSRPSAVSTVSVGGIAAVVDFLGMTPGQISLGQANIRIPSELTVAGDYPVVITIGGQSSPGRVISVGAQNR